MSCNGTGAAWNFHIDRICSKCSTTTKVKDVQQIYLKKLITLLTCLRWEKDTPKLTSKLKKNKKHKGHPSFKTFWLDGLWVVLSIISTCTTNSTIQRKFILKLLSVPKYRHLCNHCTTFIHAKNKFKYVQKVNRKQNHTLIVIQISYKTAMEHSPSLVKMLQNINGIKNKLQRISLYNFKTIQAD